MLKELLNIRSYNDLLKVLSILGTELNTAKLKLKKIEASTSASTDFTIGKGNRKGKGKVDVINVPDSSTLKRLQSYANIISTVHQTIDNIKIAKHIAARDYQNFNSVKDYLVSCDKMIAESEEAMSESRKKMNALAKSYVPAQLKTLFISLNKYLDSKFTEDFYSAKATGLNAFPVSEKGEVTTLYITASARYTNLKLKADKSDKNFAYRSFYVYLTAKVDVASGTTTYHITAAPEFKVPGTYDPGKIINEKTMTDVLAKIISFYNFAMFNERTAIPDVPSIRSLDKLPGVKKVKITNDIITILFNSNVSDSTKNGAISGVMDILKNAFKNAVTFNVNQERSLKLNQKVKVKSEPKLKDIKKYDGDVTNPLLKSDEARVAIVNDFDTFAFWLREADSKNSENKEALKRLDKLSRFIQENPDKFTDSPKDNKDAKYKKMHQEYLDLKARDKKGEFKTSPKDAKLKYNAHVKEAIKAGIINDTPVGDGIFENRKEAHPLVHIQFQAKKVSKADKSNYAISLERLNTLRDQLNLDGKDLAELKKLLFK